MNKIGAHYVAGRTERHAIGDGTRAFGIPDDEPDIDANEDLDTPLLQPR